MFLCPSVSRPDESLPHRAGQRKPASPGRRNRGRQTSREQRLRPYPLQTAPSLPTKIMPTKIRWLNISGKFPLSLGIPPLKLKILLESNPLKSRILVRRLAVPTADYSPRKLCVHATRASGPGKRTGDVSVTAAITVATVAWLWSWASLHSRCLRKRVLSIGILRRGTPPRDCCVEITTVVSPRWCTRLVESGWDTLRRVTSFQHHSRHGA